MGSEAQSMEISIVRGAPMFCTQCGCKIEDGFRFCPKCGARVVDVERQKAPQPSTGYQYCAEGKPKARMSQEEIERIADDIYSKCPNDQYKGIAILRQKANIDLNAARNMMFARYHGALPNELNAKKKTFKHEKRQRIFGPDECPRCGSKYIDSYCKAGMSITSETNLFGGMYITHPGDVNEGLKCLYCGYTWNPYKKK